MKRNLSSVSKKNKKQRGVAVIFTLGILGLLTVMALGFASTALLNNSLSKNVMNNAYARSLAKNLALTQVLYIISHKEIDSNGGFVDYRNVYTWGADGNNKDFLWKLDYTDAGVQIYKYEPDKTSVNPANNVRWQYVKDTSATPKIIGRYAYVVIPNRGRIDPSMNIGRLASNPDSATAYSIPSITSDADLKKLESIISPISTTNSCYLAVKNNFRWMTFRELAKKAAISEAAYMFDCNGISPSLAMKSPEAFWKDGKLYSRFNMNRTDWDKIKDPETNSDIPLTPEVLCGVGKTLAEFPNEQIFIPWLKDMYEYTGKDLKNQALQIAANILQYNRPDPTALNSDSKHYPTVSDQSGDWLTDPPTYAGVGRHPMLNEIAFLFRVKAHVTTSNITVDDEHGTITCTYTPTYFITFDAGAELIYPFGTASGLKESIIQFPDMEMQFRLRKFLKAGKSPDPQTTVNNLGSNLIDSNGILNADMLHSDLDRINIKIPGKSDGVITYQKLITESSTVVEPMSNTDSENYAWTNLNFSSTTNSTLEASDWNASPAYTKYTSFWKGDKTGKQQTLKMQIRNITITTSKSLFGENTDEHVNKIAEAMARRMTIEWEKEGSKDYSFTTPDTVVLKYDGEQRDVAKLEAKKLPDNMTNMYPEKVWFVVYEAKDPLTHHKSSDWAVKLEGPKDLDESRLTTNGYYPGTLSDGSADKHVNNPVKDILAEGSSDPEVKAILTSYGYGTDGDPAYVTGTSRLPASFIRHGPMRSFWELGCISRGNLFETLNLKKKDNSASADLDFSYAKGDGILFDQLKFTNENYSAGKINLNTDMHRVLEKVFNNSLIGYKENLIKASGDVLPDAGTAPLDNPIDIGVIDTSTGKPVLHSTPSAAECIACQLINATKSYALKNRGDLLSEQAKLPTAAGETAPSLADWGTLQNLLLNGDNYLEKIQILSKLMPVLRTDPVDTLYVVILAQSIRDVGGDIPVLVDWDGNGLDTAVPSTEGAAKKKAMFKAGYRRAIDGAAIVGLTEPGTSGSDSAGSRLLLKTYTKNAIGTYDLGRDKITGETRLVATLVRDPAKRKWKLVRLQYVE